MSHVLIVDDEPNVVRFFPLTLQQAGFTCQAAWTKRQALAAAAAHWPDVVLLDLTLATADDGWEIWDELALQARGRPLRVIIVSGELTSARRTEARRRGAAATLAKTVPPASLVKAVRTALTAGANALGGG